MFIICRYFSFKSLNILKIIYIYIFMTPKIKNLIPSMCSKLKITWTLKIYITIIWYTFLLFFFCMFLDSRIFMFIYNGTESPALSFFFSYLTLYKLPYMILLVYFSVFPTKKRYEKLLLLINPEKKKKKKELVENWLGLSSKPELGAYLFIELKLF